MTCNIDNIYKISESYLNQRFYFQSLAEAGLSCGLLDDRDLSRLKLELSALLAEQSDKLNGGRSTSVHVEEANELIKSMLFVIGIRLKAYKSPDEAAAAMKNVPVRQLFEKGIDNIRRRLIYSRRLHRRILKNLFYTPNIYYRSTVEDGINGFFKLYNPQFCAHEINITADYPVLFGRPQLDGIEFIERYLQCIEAENEFCVLFDSCDVHRLLLGVSRDYSSCPMNIFEPVLLSALALEVLGHNPLSLELSADDIQRLTRLMRGKSEPQIKNLLIEALGSFGLRFAVAPKLKSYAASCVTKLLPTVKYSVENGTADKIFAVPAGEEKSQIISFSCEGRMNDDDYRRFVEKLLLADGREKVEIIFREVHSMADLLDVLADAQLDAADFELFVNRLPEKVFLFLESRYPDDSFLQYESEMLLCDALKKRKSFRD